MSRRARAYSVVLEKGKVQVNLVKRWLDDAIRVETKDSLAAGVWTHVAVTYDGSRVCEGREGLPGWQARGRCRFSSTS